MSENSQIVYLNGQFMPMEKAYVPVLDRGFIFGDGVYEVIPIYGGNILRLEEHLNRLDYSLEGIRLANPMSREQWKDIFHELIRKNANGDLSIYLQITRGVAPRDHGFPENLTPTIFAMCSPLKPLASHFTTTGANAITTEDIRWQFCNIKSTSLLANTMLRQFALDKKADEAILIKGTNITEGSASSVFVVINNEIITPPKGTCILPGITRDLVIELANTNNIKCTERNISVDEIKSCDEIWVTSSLREILPVTTLDNLPVGSGTPGPIWKKTYALYQDYKQKIRAGSAV
ncbi:MAG: D-amino acid aminotransferase [Gammaproteobacteria bacterium]|nr:D-amino acid aminotransferase [Gammaproteobacteria bacterium]